MFTDHPYGCAFRGLGCPQATFAVESQMDELAEKLGIDPIDLRMKNLLRPGDTTIWGQEMLEERGLGIAECLTRVREAIGWDKPLTPSEDPDVRRGKGVACYMYGTGTGYITDGAHCFVQAQPDGSLNIGISSNELGQGFLIAMRQIAADTFGVPIEKGLSRLFRFCRLGGSGRDGRFKNDRVPRQCRDERLQCPARTVSAGSGADARREEGRPRRG